MVEPLRTFGDGRGDVIEVIGHHGEALELDTERPQFTDQKCRVLLDELPAENLVADNDDPGGRHAASIPGMVRPGRWIPGIWSYVAAGCSTRPRHVPSIWLPMSGS